MITVEVRPRSDAKYDIHVDAGNHQALVNSSQGYDNVSDATAAARKLFGHPAGVTLNEVRRLAAEAHDTGRLLHPEVILAAIADGPPAEPVRLVVTYRNGTSWREDLR